MRRYKPYEPTAEEITIVCIELRLRKPREPMSIKTSLEHLCWRYGTPAEQ
jgi:hypothetical protein